MKTVRAAMAPGDLVGWVYNGVHHLVDRKERVWSSIMRTWVPIDEPALVLIVAPTKYTWLNSRGIFHAAFADIINETSTFDSDFSVPCGCYPVVLNRCNLPCLDRSTQN